MEVYRRLNEIAQEIDTRERATLMEPSSAMQQYRLGLVLCEIREKLPKRFRHFRQP